MDAKGAGIGGHDESTRWKGTLGFQGLSGTSATV